MALPLETREIHATACLKEAVALRPALLQYARKLTNGNDEEAQELVQEATLRLHEGTQRNGMPAGPLKPRLLAIIRNVHIDEQRRGVRIQSLSVASEDGEDWEHPGATAYGLQQQHDAEAAQKVRSLGQLAAQEMADQFPLVDRILFRLSAEGFPTRTIAEMTGNSQSTIARRVNAIRWHLHAFLLPLMVV